MRVTFLPYNYQRLLYQRLQNLKQVFRTVDDYTTEFYQFIPLTEIQKMEDQLVSRYIGGLKLQIQDTVNMFDPVNVFTAHQRALMVEKQLQRAVDIINIGSDAGNSKNGAGLNKSGSNGSGQFNRGDRISGMKCFGCGETGHKLAKCKKTTGKKALGVKADDCDDTKLDIEGEPVYDEDTNNEVLLEGDVGTTLVV